MGREIYRADNLRQISQSHSVQATSDAGTVTTQRQAFLNMRMPGVFTRYSNPQNPSAPQISELTDQHALDVLNFRFHFQMPLTALQARIQNDLTASLPLDPEEAEEAVIVLTAFEDLERFVNAVALQKAIMPALPRQFRRGDTSTWTVPYRKPEASMYPVLEYPDMRAMLGLIFEAAGGFEAWL